MTIVQPTQGAYKSAVKKLRDGGVVSFSTETVYGLGCDTFNKEAIAKIYKLKNRPKNNPMIAHIADVSWVDKLCSGWSTKCDQLAEHFWPGPLTIVLPKKEVVPESACGGFETIAIRLPAHPVARELLAQFNGPISAPSANKSGHISPTTAQHVEEDFGGSVLVIDGGPCETGIESTVISMVDRPEVLRLGSITVEELSRAIGRACSNNATSQSNSPGTTMRHYAPNTPTAMLDKELVEAVNNCDCVVLSIHATPEATKKTIQMPPTPKNYAKKLYASLREADSIGAKKIIIESPGKLTGWQAVNDRLCRCCSA